MAVAHKNYYPPAGTVEVTNDPGWSWNGRAWTKGGRVGVPPKGAPLRGKAGTQMAGWVYDWSKYAWIEPSGGGAIQHRPPRPHPGPQPGPQPQPQPQQIVIQQQPKKEEAMSKCEHPHHAASIYDGIKNHPLVPLLGLGVLVASDFLTQPSPPQIPPELPEAFQKMWMLIYEQNLNSYTIRKQMLDKWGQVLLTIGVSGAGLSEAVKHQDQLAGVKKAA
jgi:hypothetical protein